jgi:hypothetical protein
VPKQEAKEIIAGSVAVNQKVVWSFSPCGDIQVNDKKLELGKTVKEWVTILGPYDRYNRLMNDAYTWDKYGLIAVTDWNKDTVSQMHVVFHYESDRDPADYAGRNDVDSIIMRSIQAEISARPKPVLSGGVLLDGVVLGRGMSIKEFNHLSESNSRAFKFTKDIFSHRYSFYPNDCSSPIRYYVELSEDFKDVEQVFINGDKYARWEIEQEEKAEAAKQKH